MLRIGLDIGGTKIELAALDDGGRERLRRRHPTPHGAYEDALGGVAEMVREAERELGGRASVGIGHPGTLDAASGRVKNAYATPFNGRPLKADLEQALGRELRFENDATCFALSEASDGAGRGYRIVFGIVLGTGAGGGIVVDGRALRGPNGITGEWGHIALPWMTADEFPGPECYCGRRGCIERFVSGTALRADHKQAEGEELRPSVIVQRAAAGDTACERTLRRYENRLARALSLPINFLDPEVIVVGGGLSTMARLYDNVPRLWNAFIYSDSVRTRLVQAAHGAASGVRGAAMLWP